MRDKLIEIFGWYGTVAIVGAYALVSFSILQPTSIWYQLLNGTGALGIVIVAFHKKDWQPGVLNIIWTVIAVIAIVQILFR
jgi:hypothetical protein